MLPARFTIGPAAPADIPDVLALFDAYAGSLDVDLFYQEFDAERAGLPGKYAPPAGALLIARDGAGAAIGCVAMRPLEGGVCEMKRMYVAPEARGLGLGRALMDAILAAGRAAGYAVMRLDTLPSLQAALAMYRAAGFREIAAYYETPVAGTVFLELSLERSSPARGGGTPQA